MFVKSRDPLAVADYVSMLHNYSALECYRQMMRSYLTFSQAKARVHTENVLEIFFQNETLEFQDWSAYLPEFDTIQGLYEIVWYKRHEVERQYQKLLAFKNAFTQARKTWYQLDLATLDVLVPDHMLKCANIDIAYKQGSRDQYRFSMAEKSPQVCNVPVCVSIPCHACV
ncbi:hypothetical protein FVE85_8511 [Porphyridium purpureum]|uniref:Uncharacterized protein n=1 Tax=Porphyridium purpureum TaxID=35688 RepID=A0A5J4YGG0_PORPP|nr:hypothetical protein FVE85_8511 [Porphyridium purpureum]|eukprot:POR3037..scf257_31